jgi:hypothetical protein
MITAEYPSKKNDSALHNHFVATVQKVSKSLGFEHNQECNKKMLFGNYKTLTKEV